MTYFYRVLLIKFAIDIAHLALFLVTLMDLFVNVIFFPFWGNIHREFLNPNDMLDLPRVESMVFPQLP